MNDPLNLPELTPTAEDWAEEKLLEIMEQSPPIPSLGRISQLTEMLERKTANQAYRELTKQPQATLFHLTPLLVIDGEGDEKLGLTVDGGFVVALRKHGETLWTPIIHLPPKLLAYLDTFMAQHYPLLNNRYGIATDGTTQEPDRP